MKSPKAPSWSLGHVFQMLRRDDVKTLRTLEPKLWFDFRCEGMDLLELALQTGSKRCSSALIKAYAHHPCRPAFYLSYAIEHRLIPQAMLMLSQGLWCPEHLQEALYLACDGRHEGLVEPLLQRMSVQQRSASWSTPYHACFPLSALHCLILLDAPGKVDDLTLKHGLVAPADLEHPFLWALSKRAWNVVEAWAEKHPSLWSQAHDKLTQWPLCTHVSNVKQIQSHLLILEAKLLSQGFQTTASDRPLPRRL